MQISKPQTVQDLDSSVVNTLLLCITRLPWHMQCKLPCLRQSSLTLLDKHSGHVCLSELTCSGQNLKHSSKLTRRKYSVFHALAEAEEDASDHSARQSAAARVATLSASIATALIVHKAGDKDAKIKPLMSSAWRVSHPLCVHFLSVSSFPDQL